MNIKKTLKAQIFKVKKILIILIYKVTKWTKYRIFSFGIDPYLDIQFHFKDYNFALFFDIGANIGQTTDDIRNIFPDSEIWAFEPVKKTFEILKVNTNNKNVNCFQLGFGDKNFETEIFVKKDGSDSRMNSILNEENSNINSVEKEKIKIETLDTFCKIHDINKIDYVKIDTEGYDLKVLKGSYELLNDQKISFVEVEVSMNPENTLHVKFEDVKEYMESFDYRVYGIYDQKNEWKTNTPILRRVNILFVSKTTYSNK